METEGKNILAKEYEKYVVDWMERNENEVSHPNIQPEWSQFLPTQVIELDIENEEYENLASAYNCFVLSLFNNEGSAPVCYEEWLGAEALYVDGIQHLLEEEE